MSDKYDEVAEKIHSGSFSIRWSEAIKEIAAILREAFPAPIPSPLIGTDAPRMLNDLLETLERGTSCDEIRLTRGLCKEYLAALRLAQVAQEEYPEEDKPAGWSSWKAMAEEMERNWIGATKTHNQEKARGDELSRQLTEEQIIRATLWDALYDLRYSGATIKSEDEIAYAADVALGLDRSSDPRADISCHTLASERAKREGEAGEWDALTKREMWETIQEIREAVGNDGTTHVEDDVRELVERARPAPDATALREALTPSTETKAAYMGEFRFSIPDQDEEGNETTRKIDVPWTTIKEIMAAIKARALLRSEPRGEETVVPTCENCKRWVVACDCQLSKADEARCLRDGRHYWERSLICSESREGER